jgi:hypothetical protein
VKYLLWFLLWTGIGLALSSWAFPALKAKLEALDLDEMWEVWDA